MPEQDWITLTSADVIKRLNPDEVASYNALSGSDDALTPLLGDVIDETRGKIKAGGRSRGPDGTIPRSLKGAVIAITIWRWITGFSKNDKLQTDGRKKNNDAGEDALNRVAKGEQPVELPDAGAGADTVAAPRNAIATIRTGRNVSTCKFDGEATT